MNPRYVIVSENLHLRLLCYLKIHVDECLEDGWGIYQGVVYYSKIINLGSHYWRDETIIIR